MRVHLADPLSPDCEAILREAGVEVSNRPGLQGDELIKAVSVADGLIVRSATRVTSELIAAAPKLRVIGRAGTGVDNIDVEAATMRGIVVMNAPGANTLSAAEHTVAMLLSLSRNIPAADQRLRSGEWNKSGLTGVELYGKTLGVIGMGRIGREVAERARGFGLEILAYDPFLPAEVAAQLDYEVVDDLEQIYARSDFLSVHVPMNDRTRHLLDAETLARCKPGVRIVNCARGGVIDEAALLDSIEAGHVAGAALDVFEHEPLPDNSPLRKYPQIVMTPHLGASTVEAQDKVAQRMAEQVVEFLRAGAVRNAVNLPALEPGMAARLQPFQRLGEILGLMHARLLKGSFEDLWIELRGEVLELPTQPLSSAVLKGFLDQVLSEAVNVVNAEAVARKHGYAYSEIRSSEPTDYKSLVKVTLKTDQGIRVLSGTLFGHRFPRIVRVDDFTVDAVPEGEMLISCNIDRPGMLEAIARTISEAGVNIANLSLGRSGKQGLALSLINLDSPLPAEGLAALRAIDGLDWCESASL